MRCLYCEAEVTEYPDNGICVCCGGRLPPRPAGVRCPDCGNYASGNFCAACGRDLTGKAQPRPAPVQTVVQPVYIPVTHAAPVPGVNCCPKCRSDLLVHAKRGFRWGLGILCFFLIPFFGLALGFIGSGEPYLKCNNCGHKWKHR